MAFIEDRLLTRVAYGFTGGPTFLTITAELYSGITARNAERSTPLYVFNAPYGNIQAEHLSVVVAAFNACLGRLHSFRFKDHADYQLTGEVIGTSDGSTDETMQLTKAYTFDTTTTTRTIKKPVSGTVVLLQDGAALSSTVDTTTGIVTFTSTAGKVITATCEFDVPVMFMNDDLQFSINELNAHSSEINLKEDLGA